MSEPQGQTAGRPEAGEPPRELSDEELFAEEFDRRAADERDGAPPEPTPEPLIDVAPEPQVADDEGDADPNAEAGAEAPPTKPSWYNELSDEAKLAFDQQESSISTLQQQYSAVHGRLAPVQAQVARLQRQLSTPQPTQQASTGGQPTPTDPTPAPDFESKEFLEFAENYPDEAAQMRRLWVSQQTNTQRLEQRLDSMSRSLENVQSVSNTQTYQTELQTLAERHPDWMTVRHSPQFESWLQTQPDALQPMVESAKASECAYILDRYKQDVYLHELQLAGDTPAPAAPSRASATAQHRESLRLHASPDPQGGGVGVPGVTRAALTDEELWVEELARRVRSQKQSR